MEDNVKIIDEELKKLLLTKITSYRQIEQLNALYGARQALNNYNIKSANNKEMSELYDILPALQEYQKIKKCIEKIIQRRTP